MGLNAPDDRNRYILARHASGYVCDSYETDLADIRKVMGELEVQMAALAHFGTPINHITVFDGTLRHDQLRDVTFAVAGDQWDHACFMGHPEYIGNGIFFPANRRA